jgi:hypothetical protein
MKYSRILRSVSEMMPLGRMRRPAFADSVDADLRSSKARSTVVAALHWFGDSLEFGNQAIKAGITHDDAYTERLNQLDQVEGLLTASRQSDRRYSDPELE